MLHTYPVNTSTYGLTEHEIYPQALTRVCYAHISDLTAELTLSSDDRAGQALSAPVTDSLSQ